jgi:uncharacterized protein YkwD
MGRKLSYLLLAATLLGLGCTPVASAAVHVANHRALKRDSRAAASGSAGASLIASLDTCPGQDNLAGGLDAQEEAMRCMIDFARQRTDLGPLADSAALDSSAAAKTTDLLACDDFSHEACGRPFSYWIAEAGYLSTPCWHVGENLAWGAGADGSVRSIFRAWMRSPEHRANILGDFTQIGIDREVGTLEGRAGTDVWTQHFGSHCEAPAG